MVVLPAHPGPSNNYSGHPEVRSNQYYFGWPAWEHVLGPFERKEEATEKPGYYPYVGRGPAIWAFAEFELPVNKKALVVGGGIAGMNCALSIAKQGHEVYLVEKEPVLGGMARKIHTTQEGLDVQAYLTDLIAKVYKNPLIHVYTEATIEEAVGYVGNFTTTVKSPRGIAKIEHGATVIAIGADLSLLPIPLQGRRQGHDPPGAGDRSPKATKSAGCGKYSRDQCVGCRNEDRNYCSRVCCSESIKTPDLKEKPADGYLYSLPGYENLWT